jgi:predicted dehydrogenase
VNVLWDLACHDISVVNYIVEEKPSHVRAIGKLHPIYATEDIAYMFLYYPSGSLVQISTSWASPVKIRKMIVGGEKKMMIYDDIEPTNKLIIYDYEAIEPTDENKQMVLVDYRLGNISIPKYQIIEPLKMVLGEFFECIGTGSKPLSDGACALQIVDILEKAEESLKLNGQLIALN